MSKMIIMQGLPASGKSTKAKELMESMGNAVRVNKDLLRTMLHFDKFTGKNEGVTQSVARGLVADLMAANMPVIVDDTNLNPRTLQSWKDLAKEMGAKVEIVRVATHYEECIERDRLREKRVGAHVIYQMALQYDLVPLNQEFVVCDIDGTLASLEHRLHFLYEDPANLVPKAKKDWDGFFGAMEDDGFRREVWDQVVACGKKVILVSARPDTYREETDWWLAKHGLNEGMEYETLIMRRGGDSRDDDLIKKEIAEKYFAHQKIVKVFDDRPRVIRMWCELGLDVVDVGTGREF